MSFKEKENLSDRIYYPIVCCSRPSILEKGREDRLNYTNLFSFVFKLRKKRRGERRPLPLLSTPINPVGHGFQPHNVGGERNDNLLINLSCMTYLKSPNQREIDSRQHTFTPETDYASTKPFMEKRRTTRGARKSPSCCTRPTRSGIAVSGGRGLEKRRKEISRPHRLSDYEFSIVLYEAERLG